MLWGEVFDLKVKDANGYDVPKFQIMSKFSKINDFLIVRYHQTFHESKQRQHMD